MTAKGRLLLRAPVLLAAAILFTAPGASAGQGSGRCPDARYDVVGEPIHGDAGGADIEIGASAGVGEMCPLSDAAVRTSSRRGITAVAARWDACRGLDGPVFLRGRIADGCTRFVGTLRAKNYHRRVQALRSDCGDGILDAVSPATPYTSTLESLGEHPLPAWYDDAKFGIMVHWGIFTIPAWAETVIDPGEWLSGKLLEPPDFGREFFTHIPYVEWYSNTILIDGSPAQQHHIATYGAGFPYENFRPEFEKRAAAWSGDAWADLFRQAGAHYVVLVTKHHDGFALWPTAVTHPTRPGWNMSRDVVGELSSAVRRRCMRMGLYYSGGFDWSVHPGPVRTALDAITVAPQTPEYIAYADAQWRELIERYRPAVLWNDIGYPVNANVLQLFADYYNSVPDGVVNDRFTILPAGTHHDYVTPEFSAPADISPEKFETVRGMGRGFGYNQNESDADLDSAEELIHLLVDVVSKNGNLLLNVGPLADGTVPESQASRLRAIGAWLAINGEAIFGTHPWTRFGTTTSDGTPVRFTASAEGKTLYAIVLGPLPAGELTIVGLDLAPSSVRLLGSKPMLSARQVGGDLQITLPEASAAEAAYAFALEL